MSVPDTLFKVRVPSWEQLYYKGYNSYRETQDRKAVSFRSGPLVIQGYIFHLEVYPYSGVGTCGLFLDFPDRERLAGGGSIKMNLVFLAGTTETARFDGVEFSYRTGKVDRGTWSARDPWHCGDTSKGVYEIGVKIENFSASVDKLCQSCDKCNYPIVKIVETEFRGDAASPRAATCGLALRCEHRICDSCYYETLGHCAGRDCVCTECQNKLADLKCPICHLFD